MSPVERFGESAEKAQLAARMLRAGELTQVEIARTAGTSRSQVQRIWHELKAGEFVFDDEERPEPAPATVEEPLDEDFVSACATFAAKTERFRHDASRWGLDWEAAREQMEAAFAQVEAVQARGVELDEHRWALWQEAQELRQLGATTYGRAWTVQFQDAA